MVEDAVVDPGFEMRRLAGSFALLLAAIYGLLLVVAVSDLVRGVTHPVGVWLLLLVPAPVFGPAVVAGIRLHRTRDREVMRRLWPKALLAATAGMALTVAAAVAANRIQQP